MVAEDREPEEAEDVEPERLHSPGAASEMSGTTAVTSRSLSQLAHIKSNVIDILPDLFQTSEALLDLLIPAEVTTKSVDRTTKNLMAPGSGLANKLRSSEADFIAAREKFGTEEYIDNSFILRKLFGSEACGIDFHRPDPVNYLANLATLVKNFLVSQEASSRTSSMLYTLDTWFPRAFALKFNEHLEIGGTALLDESFDIGLEIRTQFVIRELEERKDDDVFSPRTILASVFYHPPKSKKPTSKTPIWGKVPPGFFEDANNNEHLRDVLGDMAPNSEEQARKIQQRVLDVSESFNDDIAVAAGDPMDFDHLKKWYPWIEFLTKLLQWAQFRYHEISGSIEEQGGVDAIVGDVKDIIDEINSQDTDLEQDSVPNTQEVASSAPIIPSSSRER